MPIKRLYDYLKWKTNLEAEKRRIVEEKSGKIKI